MYPVTRLALLGRTGHRLCRRRAHPSLGRFVCRCVSLCASVHRCVYCSSKIYFLVNHSGLSSVAVSPVAGHMFGSSPSPRSRLSRPVISVLAARVGCLVVACVFVCVCARDKDCDFDIASVPHCLMTISSHTHCRQYSPARAHAIVGPHHASAMISSKYGTTRNHMLKYVRTKTDISESFTTRWLERVATNGFTIHFHIPPPLFVYFHDIGRTRLCCFVIEMVRHRKHR